MKRGLMLVIAVVFVFASEAWRGPAMLRAEESPVKETRGEPGEEKVEVMPEMVVTATNTKLQSNDNLWYAFL